MVLKVGLLLNIKMLIEQSIIIITIILAFTLFDSLINVRTERGSKSKQRDNSSSEHS